MTNVFKATAEQLNRMETFYRDDLKINSNEHVLFSVNSISITAYKSGKVVFQGPKALVEYNMWLEMFGMAEEVAEKEAIYYSSSIGSDEVGKGDYFGPLVVCACYVPDNVIPYLQELRITDSKKRTDERIKMLAKKIKDKLTYSVLVLDNLKYNELVDKGYSVVKMMAILHNKALLNVKKKSPKTNIYIDQFTEPGVYYHYVKGEKEVLRNATFETKAESKHISVACASIIARYKYLNEMDRLSEEIGFTLPKGGGKTVDETIKKIIDTLGEDALRQYGKVSFRNTEKAKNL